MKSYMITAISLFVITAASPSFSAERSRCEESDKLCREFEIFAEAGQFEKILAAVDSGRTYSAGARHYIGQAYLSRASAESNTPEQEEAFCRKAIAYGAAQGYMGLYFLYAGKDENAALGFLREYIATRPRDSVPFVILGEAELDRKNYALADRYLRESKKVARANSGRVDWMLFQANYLLGNYEYASEMLGSALTNGKFDREFTALQSDPRFNELARHAEFRKYQPVGEARE